MSKTAFTTSNNLTKKVWEEKLYRDTRKAAYFSRFMGDTSESLIQEKTDLTKEQGDKITFGIRMRLTGSGVTSGQQLEGNEEKLQTYDFSVTLEQYRHAVRDNGKMDRQRAMFSIDKESKMALQDWGGEKIDQLMFDALGIGSGSTTDPTKIFYKTSDSGTNSFLATGTAATAKAALSATNSLLTLDFITKLKAWAVTGGNRAYTPLRPVKVDGKKYYVLLVHPDALADLKTTSAFQNAMQYAQERGDENPLFTGATAIWQGVVIHEHENCYVATDGGGASVAWTKAIFMGAQAGVFAWGQKEEVIQKKFDYDNENGYAWGIIGKAGKAQFNSLDYGSMGVYLARTNISGV
jgi:N4-gp56 family major capsid protein